MNRLGYTRMAMPWHPLAVAIVAGAIPAAAGHGATVAFPAALLAAATGFAIDDESMETLAASPTSLLRRRLLRLSAMIPAAILGWSVLVLIPAARGSDEALTLLAMFAGLLALSVGFASSIARRSRGRGGALGASALLLALIVSSIVHPRWRPLPLGDVPGGWSALQMRWSLAAVTGIVIFLAASRDPAARRAWRRT